MNVGASEKMKPPWLILSSGVYRTAKFFSESRHKDGPQSDMIHSSFPSANESGGDKCT